MWSPPYLIFPHLYFTPPPTFIFIWFLFNITYFFLALFRSSVHDPLLQFRLCELVAGGTGRWWCEGIWKPCVVWPDAEGVEGWQEYSEGVIGMWRRERMWCSSERDFLDLIQFPPLPHIPVGRIITSFHFRSWCWQKPSSFHEKITFHLGQQGLSHRTQDNIRKHVSRKFVKK